MTKDQLLKQPIWQLTGEQFLELLNFKHADEPQIQDEVHDTKSHTYVYGIAGLCKLFQCSKSTAHRIKNSGVIKDAITQTGRKIIIDAELALEKLRSSKKGGRRCKS